jgi:hypothetical protein
MSSKHREARLEQKAYWEEKLNQRLAVLNDKGTASEKIAKDPFVRNARAKIRKSEFRLKAIIDLEKKLKEMEKAKAEKIGEPKKLKGKKKQPSQEESSAVSKRRQKKIMKKEDKIKEAVEAEEVETGPQESQTE